MSKERLEGMRALYKTHQDDDSLDYMIAELRDSFLNHEVVNKKHSYDISCDTACGPNHGLFYLAEYIDILKYQNKRYREAIEYAIKESKWGDEGTALDKVVKILNKALEDEK